MSTLNKTDLKNNGDKTNSSRTSKNSGVYLTIKEFFGGSRGEEKEESDITGTPSRVTWDSPGLVQEVYEGRMTTRSTESPT